MSIIHVNRTGRTMLALRRRRRCPTCAARRTFVVEYPASPWYGATWTCLGCGDMWSDGERHERPFRPGWRPQRIAHAKAARGQLQTLAEYCAWAEGYCRNEQPAPPAEVSE